MSHLTDVDATKIMWEDTHDGGDLSKSHPIQSSLYALTFMDELRTEENDRALDAHLLSLLSRAPQPSEKSQAQQNEPQSANEMTTTYISRGETISRQLQTLVSAISSERSKRLTSVERATDISTTMLPSCSIQEGIDFATELRLMLAAPPSTPIPAATVPTVPQSHGADTSLKQKSLSSIDVGPNSMAHTTVPRSGRPRGDQTAVQPFASSKDVFIREGGTAFKPPASTAAGSGGTKQRSVVGNSSNGKAEEELPPELAHLDKALVQRVTSDILVSGQPVRFDDIAGLVEAKACVRELICWPITRPDLFQGLRALPRGVLLFGPPGTGKTLIGKAIAHEANATFFSISASSLMSKWVGEGERLVRTLFAVAAYQQPAVVFLDEVDSLLSQRSSEENEGSRRMKTEFLVQLDGAGTDLSAQVVIVGATNRPEELDEAARRRFVKRIYIPLPDREGRTRLYEHLLQGAAHSLSTDSRDIDHLVARTKGFSGADIKALCTEAAMGPIRELARNAQGDLRAVQSIDVPRISMLHFEAALEAVRPTVSERELTRYIDWNKTFGSFKSVAEPT